MTKIDRLTADPPPERYEIGTEEGEPCGRYEELDEDAPRGYKPKPCTGVMVSEDDPEWPGVTCDTCGEIA